jgi:death-on-curing protein
MTDFLTVADVIEIHRRLIDDYGGIHGLRDRPLLEAAVMRPQTGYYRDTIEQAAALWESLTVNHAFIDGNKRIGFAATIIFLSINGISLRSNQTSIIDFILSSLECKTFRYENLLIWLHENI